MNDFLNSAFGLNCKLKKIKVKDLPLFLTARRDFYMVEVEDFSFLLVNVSSEDRFGAIALEKQLMTLKNAMECEVAFRFETLTMLQRNALIERRIPFVAGSDQIYLPFLGIMLRNSMKAMKSVNANKMMPATQCLFLYLLYNHQCEYVLKKDAAANLGLTKTSITRASDQLKAMGLIIEEQHGKELRMKTLASGYDLFLLAKDYLISPVQRRLYVKGGRSLDILVKSGESALSEVSLLSAPKIVVRAIDKSNGLVNELTEIDIKWEESNDATLVELWKYDPLLFSSNGIIDPVSMAMSLSDTDDERVHGELIKFLEKYEW